ncbi:amidohydrolase family protein [Kribbella sp.]|uniref:amidohydrolase family protein n=1 Tax=Kribbella sp. TaxID=1871183 RepID=UPI002D3D0FAF|nr:amidohydrolase family protein [Kribbella sp.]HZX04848.1 amidohydrolase family protein [Kribbella sp.]
MTTWVFEGTVLPTGDTARLTFGQDPTGDQLPGRYAVPGLVDSHCHLTMAYTDTGPAMLGADFAADMLGTLARSGVSALRDVGGNREVTLELARTNDDDRPYVLAAGRFLAPANRYFPQMYEPVAPEDLLAAVETEIADGATWLKLVGDFPEVGPNGPIRGSKVGPTYDLDVIEAMVELAHARGARVAAHVTSDRVTDLIGLGIDSVEHGTALTEQDLETLGARGGAWTPTLGASLYKSPDETPEQTARRDARSEYLASILPLADRYGVRVLTGSDVDGTVPLEIALLVEHGLSVEQAITAASTGAQEFLGLSGAGNLVTYDADPREHPDVLARPAGVVLNGRRIA